MVAAGQLDGNVDFLNGCLCGPLFVRGGVLGLVLVHWSLVLASGMTGSKRPGLEPAFCGCN